VSPIFTFTSPEWMEIF